MGYINEYGKPAQVPTSMIPPEGPEGSLLGAAFEQENLTVSAMSGHKSLFAGYGIDNIEPGFDVRSWLDERGYVGSEREPFIGVRNELSATWIEQDLQRGAENNAVLDAAGAWGVGARAIASLLDFPTLLPGGSVVRGARMGWTIARAAGSAAAWGGAAAGVQELGLQATQADRSTEESLFAVGAGVLVPGLLGAGVGAMTARQAARLQDLVDLEKQVLDDTGISGIGVPGAPAAGGAAPAVRPAEDSMMQGAGGLDKAGLIPGYSIPTVVGLNAASQKAREATGLLAPTARVEANRVGGSLAIGGDVKTRADMLESRATLAHREHRNIYGNYYFGADHAVLGQEARANLSSRFGASGKVGPGEFNILVGRAARRGDELAELKTGDPLLDEAVAKSAKAWRATLFDPLKEMALKHGVLLQEDVNQIFAKSYLQRVYNKEAIFRNRAGFEELLYQHGVEVRAKVRAQLAEAKTAIASAEDAAAKALATAAADRAAADAATAAATASARGSQAAAKRAASKAAASRKAANEAKKAVTAAKKGVDDDLLKIFDYTEADIRDLAYETTSQILGAPEGRIDYDLWNTPSEKRGPMKKRVLGIEDVTPGFEDFLESDVTKIGGIHARTMGPDIELARAFPNDPGLANLRKGISEEYDALIAKAGGAMSKKGRKLYKQKKYLLGEGPKNTGSLGAMYDQIRHLRGIPDDPNSGWATTLRIAKSLNYLRLLGGMTLGAIPDPGKIILEHQMYRAVGAPLKEMVTGGLKGIKLATNESRLAGVGLDLIDSKRVLAAADLASDLRVGTRLERGVGHLTSNFGTISGMNLWNTGMKLWAGATTQNHIWEALDTLASGKITPENLNRLGQSGLDVPSGLAKRVHDQWMLHGEWHGDRFVPMTERWVGKGGPEAADALRAAIRMEVDRTIVTPGVDRPLWMSTHFGSVIGQFKAFNAASLQRTLIQAGQQRNLAVLEGAISMLTLGAFSYYIRMKATGMEVSDDPRVWIAEGIDRSGLMASLSDMNALSEKVTAGWVGLSLISGRPVSRYASQSATDTALGPSIGLVKDIITVVAAFSRGEMTQSDYHKFRRMLLYQNLAYLRPVLDALEAEVPPVKLPWYKEPTQ